MIKRSIILTAITILCFTNLLSQDLISGKYSTDFKELILSRNGNQVTGAYGHDNGRLEGELNVHILKGWWHEDGNQTGKFIFTFNHDYSNFTGSWGLNDAVPSEKWNGTRISLANSNKDIENSCIELEKEIHVLKANIEKNSVAYNKIFTDVENFDKSTRLNFCTHDANHYIQYGILEFDESWNNYFSNLNKNIGLLGKIPVLSSAVDGIGKLISVLIVSSEAIETKQMPVDEAIEEYNRMREVRKTVIDKIIDTLNKYYCNSIFEDDQRLYELYNNIIPNSSLCDDHEKNMLRQEITRNRPDGLPAAIWEEHIFQSTKKNCQ